MNLSVQLAPGNKKGLKLTNPVMTASGTFGYGIEYEHLFDIQKLGAIVCKGTTLEPRDGNPQPRIAETANGMLNSIGLQNIGVDALIKEKAPVWASWQVPVIVNIAGRTIDDYAEVARELDKVPGVAGLEVNISCPNIKAGGAEFGANPESAAKVTEAVRKATALPVIMKLTPDTAEIVRIAQAVTGAGADAHVLSILSGEWQSISKLENHYWAMGTADYPAQSSNRWPCTWSMKFIKRSISRLSAAAGLPMPMTPSNSLWRARLRSRLGLPVL
jgi:dihydroorotate dehydrogenase